jgi:hypothetical protein
VSQALAKLAYSLSELAELSGVGRTFLYSEVKAGKLVLTKAGRRSIILHDHAMAWLAGLPKSSPTVPVK